MSPMKDDERARLGKIAAELVSGLSPLGRAQADVSTVLAEQVMKDTYPAVDDDTLAEFAHGLAFILNMLGSMPVSEMVKAMDSMFIAYSLAAAKLAGEYTLGSASEADGEKQYKKMKDERGKQDEPVNMAYTGQYL